MKNTINTNVVVAILILTALLIGLVFWWDYENQNLVVTSEQIGSTAEFVPEINLNSEIQLDKKSENIWQSCGNKKSRNLADEKRVLLQKHGEALRRDSDAIIVPAGQVVVEDDGMLYYQGKNLSKSDRQVLIDGNTRFYGNKIGQLPKNLFINGRTALKKEREDFTLPNKMIVVGQLSLEGDFEKLPDKLIVQEGLTLKTPNVKFLPEGLMVGKNFDARQAQFTRLPENFFVGGNITLIQSSIKELSNNLSVFGDLNLTQNPLQMLPCGLAVENTLIISGTVINEIPSDLLVGELLDTGNSGITRKIEQDPNILEKIIKKIDYEFRY